MESIAKVILTIHIIFGSLSLILFWIPVFTKKGANIHRKTGQAYSYCMWVVVVSSFILSIYNLYRGYFMGAAFLGFLGVLTTYPLWYSIAILKHKDAIPTRLIRIQKALNFMLLFMGIGLTAWSIHLRFKNQAILLLIFGLLGIITSVEVVFARTENLGQVNWIKEHINGMIVTGIAAYTAFFAFGSRTLFNSFLEGQMMVIPWILPTVIGIIGMRWWRKKLKLT